MVGTISNARPLDEHEATLLMRCCDICYKQGVCDAVETNSVARCEDFIAKVYKPKTYGLLSKGLIVRKAFILHIMMWLRNIVRTYKDVNALDMLVTRAGFCSVVPTLLQDFYLQGIRDYIQDPDPFMYDRFAEKAFRRWGTEYGKLKVYSRRDYLMQAQMFMYDRIADKSKPYREQGDDFEDWQYEMLASELWRCNQMMIHKKDDTYRASLAKFAKIKQQEIRDTMRKKQKKGNDRSNTSRSVPTWL